MKLSKRFAAAIIAICMLLTSLPAFAATVTQKNEHLDLASGTSYPLTVTQLANNNSCVEFVVSSADAATIGISLEKVIATAGSADKAFVVDGTNYDGILLSGSFQIKDYNYDPAKTADATASANNTTVSSVLKFDELTHFTFANAPVYRIRTDSTGEKLVLGVRPADLVPGSIVSAKKLKDEKKITAETEAVTFTEDDFGTLTTEEIANLTAKSNSFSSTHPHDGIVDFFSKATNAYMASNLVATAGEDYDSGFTVDSGYFPEGTIFISADRMVANGATVSSQTWGVANTWYSYQAFKGTEAPYGKYVAQKDGTYALYALKTDHNSSRTSRHVYATFNGINAEFKVKTSPTELAGKSVKGWYWEKEETDQRLTLQKGELLLVELKSPNGNARAAGFALVPVEKEAELDANAGWNACKMNDTKVITPDNFSKLHEMTTVNYVEPAPVETTVMLKKGENAQAEEITVSSVKAETVVNIGQTDFDKQPIANVTVMDVLVEAGIVTKDNKDTFKNNIVVKLNGTQIIDFDKWILFGGEEITAYIPEKSDITNFAPIKYSAIVSTNGSATGGKTRVVFSGVEGQGGTDNVTGSQISFILDDEGHLIEDAFAGAKVNGMATLSADAADVAEIGEDGKATGGEVTIPAGSPIYFDNCTFTGHVVKVGAPAANGLELEGIRGAINSSNPPAYVVMPDSSIAHHPYAVLNKTYDFTNVYITNSSTTSEVKTRYMSNTGKWLLYTDGGQVVYIVKYTVDANGKLDTVVSMQNDWMTIARPLTIELKANERAYVWGYKHYEGAGTGGTTMVPLTGVIGAN